MDPAELESKKQYLEEMEKDLKEKQRQFDIRMKEQSDRFMNDKKSYEEKYRERLAQLEKDEEMFKVSDPVKSNFVGEK